MQERKYVRIFLLIPTLIIFYFVYWIFHPFFVPLALAIILATLCYPIYTWILAKTGGRANLASLLSCTIITLLLVIPLVFFILSLAREISEVYSTFQKNLNTGVYEDLLNLEENSYLAPVVEWLSQYIDLDQVDIVDNLASALQQVSVYFLRQSTAILSGIFQFITGFFMMLIAMFFLFRDGPRLLEESRSWTPLTNRYEEQIKEKFRSISRATILGSLATSFAQGVAGGIVFWMLGVPNVLFWGAMIALASLVPVVGTAVIWVPWTVYFITVGALGKAIALALLSIFLVGMVDNVLRPLLIEGSAGMHTLLVFFSIIGGVAYFGISGLIFGPILVALGLTFLELYKLEFKEILFKPTSRHEE